MHEQDRNPKIKPAARARNEVLALGMEGICDGRPVDRCFYCALLYPELELCPHCQNRLHYEPASMMSPDQWQERCDSLVKHFQANPSRQSAEALLRLLHSYADEGQITFGQAGMPSMDSLRSAYDLEP